MSERFVEAFAVVPEKFAALFGTRAVGYDAIKKKLGRKPIFRDMVMTLGEGDDAGEALVEKGLNELAAGKRPTIEYGDRLTALVLHAYADALAPAMMESNHMPADQNGFWNPAFRALGMKTIAKEWGRSTFDFPRARRRGVEWTWPVFTLVPPASVAAWARELATPWRKKLATLPNTTFDPDADDDAEDAYMSRAEVERGVAVVEKWTRRAAKLRGRSMVLILDGDQ